jgi:ABC-type spermidine/putrescine transport system permease subunit II
MAREAEIVAPRGGLVRGLLAGWAGLVYLFLFAPIALLVAFSFNANRYGTFPFTGWTTDWYAQVFHNYQIKDALYTSLEVAALVTLISTVVGTAAAFPLVRSRLPFRTGIRVGMTLPIMIPGLLIGVSLLVLFTGLMHNVWPWHGQLSWKTAVIGQSVYTTPFVILLVSARLQGFDRALERAASDLGANTFNRLRYVVLPLILPAIIAGALLAFTLSIDEFIITYFLIGDQVTLPIYIYTQIKFGITPEVNALASMLLAASLLVLGLAFALPRVLRLSRRAVRFGVAQRTAKATA